MRLLANFLRRNVDAIGGKKPQLSLACRPCRADGRTCNVPLSVYPSAGISIRPDIWGTNDNMLAGPARGRRQFWQHAVWKPSLRLCGATCQLCALLIFLHGSTRPLGSCAARSHARSAGVASSNLQLCPNVRDDARPPMKESCPDSFAGRPLCVLSTLTMRIPCSANICD